MSVRQPRRQSLRSALAVSASVLGLVTAAHAQTPAQGQVPAPQGQVSPPQSPAPGPLSQKTALQGQITAPQSQDSAPQSAQASAPTESSTSTGGQLADIIVTAQKRSTSLQRTPLAITALDGQALQSVQVRTLEDVVGRVPALKIGNSGGYPNVAIRGIGINNFTPLAESAVALNINEVYVSRPIAFLAGLYDIADVEVLRGPQGTLYGRNATAGAINMTTARPTAQPSGYASVTFGNYQDVRTEGAVGGAIIGDMVLARIAGFRERRHGYGRNIKTGSFIDDNASEGVRGTIVLKPTSTLTATVIGEYFSENDKSGGLYYFGTSRPNAPLPSFQLLGGVVPTKERDLATQLDPIFRLRTSSATGIVEWSHGPFSLKSITGYRKQRSLSRVNISGGDPGLTYISGEPAHQFSQELQAHYDISKVHVTVGGYYFRETDRSDPGVIIIDNGLFGVPFGYTRGFETGGRQEVKAGAVFTEATVNVTDQLSLTAGIRYSSERKQLFNQFLVDVQTPYQGDFESDPLIPATALPARTFNATTPKFGIQYQLDSRTLFYATYAQGFKSGGFAAAADNTLAAAGFRPEKLTDYEGGIKTTLADGRLRLNLSGFYYNYTDLQVQQLAGLTLITVNAASAKIYGGEAEITALLSPAFTIDANGSYQHARYGRYIGPDNSVFPAVSTDFTGKRLSNAPDWQGHLGATYKAGLGSGDLNLRGEVEYSSRFYFDPTNIIAASQGSFAKGNAFLTYEDQSGFRAQLFVRNVTNRTTRTISKLNSSGFSGTLLSGAFAPPRTYGVQLGYRF